MLYLELIGAFFLTGGTILALRPAAARLGLMDLPGGHKIHASATPMVGGVGIFTGIVCMTLLSPALITNFAPLLTLSALVLFIGTLDDALGLTVRTRFTGHVLIALSMAVVAEVQLQSLGELVSSTSIGLGGLAIPMTVFATVGVINAINMADGIDGLSGGLSIVTLGLIAAVALLAGRMELVSFIAIIVCSILAFLTLNFRRPWKLQAMVYLGDAGSTMLGFILAWLLIDVSQGENALITPVYALWFLALPLYDTVNLLIRRPLSDHSPFKPGNDHLHHCLLQRGFSVEQVVLILTASALLLGLIGFAGYLIDARESWMFALFMFGFALYFYFSDWLNPAHQTAKQES